MTAKDQKQRRANRLAVDLKALHDPWIAWCSNRGLTPSEAVRQVLAAVLDANADTEVAPISSRAGERDEGERRRVEIRIPQSEFMALEAAANREGISVPRWLIGLVRTQLSGDQLYSEREVESLARSNQLLLALGRNINQIAYNMNQRAERDDLTLGQIEFVTRFLKAHVDEVAALLHASSRRWRK